MKITNFIGIDVSKKTLDIAIVKNGSVVYTSKIGNTPRALKKELKELKLNLNETLFCAEYTGIYSNILQYFLSENNANLWMESGLQIKRSQGLVRGKNDAVDAKRIALYAYKNQKEAKLWKPKRKIIDRLHHLQIIRNRLLTVIKQIQTPLKENKGFIDKEDLKEIERACRSSIRTLKKDVQKIDEKILELVKSDTNLVRLFSIITSVRGVGKVTAIAIIITSNEFKKFDTAKKYACYAGIAPFEHSSGSSIRGKTRVSHLANKNIKKLLHMAAMSAILWPGEYKEYYERKLSEGKNKMSALNAVRNKILSRIFACVRDNRLYEVGYEWNNS